MAVFNITHITRYSYTQPVIDSVNQIMLYPLQDERQDVLAQELDISGNPLVDTFTDYFGNQIGVFTVIQPHQMLTITAAIEVATHPLVEPVITEPIDRQWAALDTLDTQHPYMDYLQQEEFKQVADVAGIVAGLVQMQQAPLQNALALSTYIYQNFQYRKGITSVETGMDEIWQLKAGVCQDFAHLLLVMLRMLKIPARYVSGYICPQDTELRGEGATHAWVEAYIPYYGWLGLDPTNNCLAGERHVRLATGRNFSDCTPVKGTYKGSAAHTLEVSVVIGKPTLQETADAIAAPMFSYKVEAVVPDNNSYRKYLEAQQQQQQ
jgi:transglutaminase-like putative cysteine protease